jgi:transcriptional regulator with XRE-family HTH domain
LNIHKFRKSGEFVKALRIKSGLSQEQLSRILGYKNSQTVSNCERGITRLSIPSLSKLCTHFNIDHSELTYLIGIDLGMYYRELINKYREIGGTNEDVYIDSLPT